MSLNKRLSTWKLVERLLNNKTNVLYKPQGHYGRWSVIQKHQKRK